MKNYIKNKKFFFIGEFLHKDIGVIALASSIEEAKIKRLKLYKTFKKEFDPHVPSEFKLEDIDDIENYLFIF